jgi:hypothetical protein
MVFNNAGVMISSDYPTCEAKLYNGGEDITKKATFEWKLGNNTISTNNVLQLSKTNYTAGEYIVTAKYNNTEYTKTFTIAQTTAEVDYDLIVPSVINISTGAQNVRI